MRLLPAALLLCALAHAEDKPLLFISEVRQVEALSDPAWGKAYALLGRVTVENGRTFSLRADRALIWIDPEADANIFKLIRELKQGERGIPLWAVRAVYADGGRTPAVFQVGGQTFRCSSLYYDFRRLRGVFLDADLRLRRAVRREDAPDLVLRAKELQAVEPGTVVARNATLFQSNFQDYEVAVVVRDVRIDDEQLRTALGKLQRISAKDYREGKGPTQAELDAVVAEMGGAGGALGPDLYTLKGITLEAFGLPLMKWGEAEATGDEVMALRFEGEVGSIGNLGSGVRAAGGLGLKPVGFLVGGGYVSDHGPFATLAFDVSAFDRAVRGRTYGVYLHDHGEEDGVPPETRDRYWTQSFYRWGISPVWRLDGEYAELSDPTFLRQWDEQVAKEGLPQETLLYLRGRNDRGYVTLLTNVRTISFQDQVEELPTVSAYLPVFTLLRAGGGEGKRPVTLQVAVPASVGNLQHLQGDGSTLPDFHSWRATLDPTFYLSFPLGPFVIIPFTTAGVTAYENDLSGNSATRTTASAGIRADTQLSRSYGRVQHIVHVALAYEDLFHVSVPPNDLFPFDTVDQVTSWEGLTLNLRNRLLRSAPDGMVEFLSFELLGTWFPEGEQPFGRQGDWFLDWNLWWQATRTLVVSSRGDLEEGSLETFSLEGWWEARSNLGLGASYRHLEDDSDTITLGTEYEVSSRWALVGFSQFDARAGEASDQGVLIRRLGKTSVVGVRLTWDPGEDGLRLSFTLDLIESYRLREQRRDTLRALVGWN